MKKRTIGLEYEFLAMNTNTNLAANRQEIKQIWKDWAKKPYIELTVDPATHEPIGVYYKKDGQPDIVINTDAAVNIVEFAFLPYPTLNQCKKEMDNVVQEFLSISKQYDIALLAYGMQPVTPHYFPDLKTEKIWYRGFLRFKSLRKGHAAFHNIAAQQPCIDISFDALIPTVNTLNALSGITIALFANSGWGEKKRQPCHEEREHRWDWWNETNGEEVSLAGIPEKPFDSFQEYLTYCWSIPLRAVHRKGTLLSVWPAPTVEVYLRGGTVDALDLVTQHDTSVTPNMEDINFLSMYAWIQARPKFEFGETADLSSLLAAYDAGNMDAYAQEHLTKLYIETRHIACQPWQDRMVAPAFILGIIENIQAAHDLIQQKPWQYWIDLRKKTYTKSMEVDEVVPLASTLLDIAKQGLLQRGLGEETYIAPLYDRLAQRMSPAMQAIKDVEEKGIDAFVEERLIQI